MTRPLEQRQRHFEWNGTGTERKIGDWKGTGTERNGPMVCKLMITSMGEKKATHSLAA